MDNQVDLEIKQGDDFTLLLTFDEDISGNKFRFGGSYRVGGELAYYVEGKVRDSHSVVFSLDDKTTGALKSAKNYGERLETYYDVQMSVGDVDIRILQGIAYISPGYSYKKRSV